MTSNTLQTTKEPEQDVILVSGYKRSGKDTTAKMLKEIIEESKIKLNNLYLPRGFSVKPVLIHINGVVESINDKDYYYKIIDFGEFLS